MTIAPIFMNDFARRWQDTSAEVLTSVRRVGESGWYILGQKVRMFEAALAAQLDHRHAVGCANGLDALEMALRSVGLRRGDKVLTTPLSAFATTLAIVRAGGVPVFVDVDESGLLDLDRVEEALARDRSIAHLVPVHLYGHSLDLERMGHLVRRFDLTIVEDCCQAIGASHRGRRVGSVGRAAAISFYPTKNLGAFGDGGAITTDDGGVDAACRTLRDYGQTDKYVHDVAGLNSRLDELHAAVLLEALLPKLEGWTDRRRQIARRYLEGIERGPVRPLAVPSGSESVWHLFPVSVPGGSRDAFMAHLQGWGVQSAIHYPGLISEQKALEPGTFEVCGALERARSIAATQVSLPIHPYLRDDEVTRVIEAVNAWRLA